MTPTVLFGFYMFTGFGLWAIITVYLMGRGSDNAPDEVVFVMGAVAFALLWPLFLAAVLVESVREALR